VAEFVWCPVAESGGAGELFEFAAEVAGVDEGADLGAEHEVVVVPDVAVAQSLLVLEAPVSLQRGDGDFGDDEHPFGVNGLWFAEAQLVVLAFDGLADVHHRGSGVEFEVGPAEAEDLAGAQPSGQADKDGRFETVALRGVEQQAGFVGGQ